MEEGEVDAGVATAAAEEETEEAATGGDEDAPFADTTISFNLPLTCLIHSSACFSLALPSVRSHRANAYSERS